MPIDMTRDTIRVNIQARKTRMTQAVKLYDPHPWASYHAHGATMPTKLSPLTNVKYYHSHHNYLR